MAIRNSTSTGWTLASLVGTARALAMAWQRRRMVGRLSTLDDRLLADIGVTRQDVLSVLAESVMVDPSARLAERAAEMRRARRSTMLDARAYAPVGQPTPRRAA